ncbi:MAG: helix-turn-helix transcriptional regulator [Candidatus Pacebacteria bacterium]|nr:helix-turn-helix transcriptional regulator [Candidatus Paceibacterota bacterium]
MSTDSATRSAAESGKTISENIKRLRAKLGLTQDDLAKKADIKYTTLMKVESGTVNKPSVQTIAKIAKALGVSIEELIR